MRTAVISQHCYWTKGPLSPFWIAENKLINAMQPDKLPTVAHILYHTVRRRQVLRIIWLNHAADWSQTPLLNQTQTVSCY